MMVIMTLMDIEGKCARHYILGMLRIDNRKWFEMRNSDDWWWFEADRQWLRWVEDSEMLLRVCRAYIPGVADFSAAWLYVVKSVQGLYPWRSIFLCCMTRCYWVCRAYILGVADFFAVWFIVDYSFSTAWSVRSLYLWRSRLPTTWVCRALYL